MDIQIRTESQHQSAPARHTPLLQFRNAVLIAFAGSIVANVMILTVFGIPLALGWHFGLGWLCLAWAVLGVGSVPVRSAVGLLIWMAGLIPLVPVAMYDYEYGSYGEILAAILFIAVPMYIVFWIFRLLCGHFKTVCLPFTMSPEGVRSSQITLKYLFCLTSICAVLIGFAIPVAPILFEYVGGNFMIALLFIPGVLFLPMLFGGTKGSGSKSFKHLLLLCSMTALGVLAGFCFFHCNPSDRFMLLILSLLIFFSAGATVIGGLTMIADWRYRIGRQIENPQT